MASRSYQFLINQHNFEVKIYARHRAGCANARYCESNNDIDNQVDPILSLPFGTFDFVYCATPTTIIHEEDSKVHSGFGGLTKYSELLVQFKCDTRQQAEDRFKTFINDAVDYYNEIAIDSDSINMSLYIPMRCWVRQSRKAKRSLSTLHLPSDIVSVLHQLKKFLTPEHKARLRELSISNKTLLLFEGPSNTGKTSFAHVIASELNRSLAIINADAISQSSELLKAVNGTLNNEIVLMENIHEFCAQNSRVSISDVLNCLSGFGTRNDLIIIMTTTEYNLLKLNGFSAGKVQQVVKFDYIKTRECSAMHNSFFPGKEQQFDSLWKLISQEKVTPKMLEDFFVNHLDADDLAKHFEELSDIVARHTPKEIHTNYM